MRKTRIMTMFCNPPGPSLFKLRSVKQWICCTLLVVFPCYSLTLGTPVIAADAPSPARLVINEPVPPPVTAADADGITNPATAKRVIEQFIKHSKDHSLTANELALWSLAEFATGDFNGALAHARSARGATQDPKEKAAAYIVISQSLGALEQYDDAGFAALEGQRLDPNSRILAAYRVGFFTKSGNVLQKMAADDHLRRLDQDYDRHPVCEPMTTAAVAVILVTMIVCTTVVAVETIKEGRLSDDPNYHKTLQQMWGELGTIFKFGNLLSTVLTKG